MNEIFIFAELTPEFKFAPFVFELSNIAQNLKLKLNEFDAFPNDLKLSPEAMVDDSITPAQKDLIDKIWAYEADYWYALAQWAKANNQLTPLDRKMAYSFGTYRSRGKMFSLKQAQSGQKIINKAIELGFVK